MLSPLQQQHTYECRLCQCKGIRNTDDPGQTPGILKDKLGLKLGEASIEATMLLCCTDVSNQNLC